MGILHNNVEYWRPCQDYRMIAHLNKILSKLIHFNLEDPVIIHKRYPCYKKIVVMHLSGNSRVHDDQPPDDPLKKVASLSPELTKSKLLSLRIIKLNLSQYMIKKDCDIVHEPLPPSPNKVELDLFKNKENYQQ